VIALSSDISTTSSASSAASAAPAVSYRRVTPDLIVGEPTWMGLTYTIWLKISIVAGLFAWLFYTPCLRRLWQKTNPFTGEPNWGHAIVIPVVGLYYLYLNRDELLAARAKPLL